MALSFDQLRTLASQAGFNALDARVAAAIALAESGGNPEAVGDNGTSVGLWQIHLPAHPEDASLDLKDPAINAMAAQAIYATAGNSFTPWTTYRTGAFKRFLPTPAQAKNGAKVAFFTFLAGLGLYIVTGAKRR